jgi:Mor family transcriptional regulator
MKRYEKIERVKKRLGEKKTLGLIFLFSGEHIHVPKEKSLRRTKRDDMIVRDYRAGTQFKELSLKYGLDDSWIRKLIKRMKSQDDDGLFENKKIEK